MERFARAGDWDRVRELVRERDTLLAEYQGAERAAVFAASLRCTESIADMAIDERREAAGRQMEHWLRRFRGES